MHSNYSRFMFCNPGSHAISKILADISFLGFESVSADEPVLTLKLPLLYLLTITKPQTDRNRSHWKAFPSRSFDRPSKPHHCCRHRCLLLSIPDPTGDSLSPGTLGQAYNLCGGGSLSPASISALFPGDWYCLTNGTSAPTGGFPSADLQSSPPICTLILPLTKGEDRGGLFPPTSLLLWFLDPVCRSKCTLVHS